MKFQPRLPLAAAALAAALLIPAAPALADQAPKILKKVPPEFPAAATRKGVDKGVLKVRVTVDGSGAVTEATIIETQPSAARVLNDSVVSALNQWRFEGSGKPSTFELQVVLTAD
jgi:periplasmic protein TonB